MIGCDIHLERRSLACLNESLVKVFALYADRPLVRYSFHPGVHILLKSLILEGSFAYHAFDERP